MDYSILKSRTTWTIVAMFVVGGLNAIVPILPPQLQAALEGILAIAAGYFHQNTNQPQA